MASEEDNEKPEGKRPVKKAFEEEQSGKPRKTKPGSVKDEE